MKQYLENIKTLNGVEAMGDISYVSSKRFLLLLGTEFLTYMPGTRESAAGWRETGHYLRCMSLFYVILLVSHYFENSTPTIIRRQFRFSNRSWQPYWHSVSAWEKGLVIKHVLMSL